MFTTVLLILRIVSALLLLAFVGLIFLYLHRDLTRLAQLQANRTQRLGELVVLESRAANCEEGDRYSLRAVTRVGRAPTNTIVLDDGFTSGEHALILRRGTQWLVEDLGSRNGTLINEQPVVATAVLSTGDILTVGSTKLQLSNS